jgi:hypothetical protein
VNAEVSLVKACLIIPPHHHHLTLSPCLFLSLTPSLSVLVTTRPYVCVCVTFARQS